MDNVSNLTLPYKPNNNIARKIDHFFKLVLIILKPKQNLALINNFLFSVPSLDNTNLIPYILTSTASKELEQTSDNQTIRSKQSKYT